MVGSMKISRIVGIVFVLLLLAGAFEIIRHSGTVESVRVTLRSGAVEPAAGMGDSSGPDYRLLLRAGDDWVDCGVRQDTHIGSGLDFPVNELVSWRALAELRFEEDDLAGDDLLERMPVDGTAFEGKVFAFELSKGFDVQAGIGWFFSTPLGMVLASGLALGLLLMVVLNWA